MIPRHVRTGKPPPEGRFSYACRAVSVSSGARARTRTEDLVLTKNALYQLSYAGPTCLPVAGEPRDWRAICWLRPPLCRVYGGGGRIRTCVAQRAPSLQPGAIDRSATPPFFAWSRRWDSNPRPSDYKSLALPLRHFGRRQTPKKVAPIWASAISIGGRPEAVKFLGN